MATRAVLFYSPEEYLALERTAEYKSEYIDGLIYAMAGASITHNLLTGNMVTDLNLQLRDTPCRVFPSDMKVRIPGNRKFLYPDVSVVCGELQFFDTAQDVVLNPVLIVEVLSESTAGYDRGKKFRWYQTLPSLQEYVLITQDEAVVESFVRQTDGWFYQKVVGLENSITLSSIGINVALKNIYIKIEL